MAPEYLYELHQLLKAHLEEIEAALAQIPEDPFERERLLGQKETVDQLREFLGRYVMKVPRKLRGKFFNGG